MKSELQSLKRRDKRFPNHQSQPTRRELPRVLSNESAVQADIEVNKNESGVNVDEEIVVTLSEFDESRIVSEESLRHLKIDLQVKFLLHFSLIIRCDVR
jgi:hypothetical protein